MNVWGLVFALIVLLSNQAQAASVSPYEADKAYLRLTPDELTELIFDIEPRPLHFGLSETQKNEILDLTQGEVDFRNLYLLPRVPYAKSIDLQLPRKSILGYGKNNHVPPGQLLLFKSDADPLAQNLWWLEQLEVPKAWELATGKNIVIADCDAGFYTDEVDIKDNLLLDYRYDFSDTDAPDIVDDGNYTFHGTAVAAIMAGVLNATGTNGIAYDAKIIPFQNFNYASNDKKDKEEATAQCILKSITIPEVDIIVLENQTHGSSETFEGTRLAVHLALLSGVPVISAAGNSYNQLTEEAKHDTGSIIVGALTKEGKKAAFSNYGDRVSIAAFGEDLYTLFGPEGLYAHFSGTSGATPQVAATVALMLELNPELTPQTIKDILIDTRSTTEENKLVGGQLNTYKAVQAAKDFVIHPKLKRQRQQMQQFRQQLIQIIGESL